MAHRFTQEIIVNQNREKVAELYSHIDSFRKWFRNVEEISNLTPEQNDIGSKYLIKGNLDGKPWDAVLEIENKEIPSMIKWSWNTHFYTNKITTRFIVENENQTRIRCEHKIEFFGFLSIFDTFRLTKIKAQFQRDLEAFKVLSDQ